MHKVVIVGGGFAGIRAAKGLAHLPVAVTIIDRKNHHTFQPLLYQVATATLPPSSIAQPIRVILQNQKNTTILLEEVVAIDVTQKQVRLSNSSVVPYDYLIIASGASHSYFGHPEWEEFAPGLKTIEDALQIRRRVLLAFEKAEAEMAKSNTHQPLNFVIIGAGPTGVELAGAIADTCRLYLPKEYRHINTKTARIILLEALPNVLGAYPEDLSASAVKQLKECGVEVMTNTKVLDIHESVVMTSAGKLDAAVIVWAAGVQASPLGKLIGATLDRRGCVLVDEYLNPPGHKEIFVCGDLAHVEEHGRQIPGVAQSAMQMGTYCAQTIESDLHKNSRRAFTYKDKGDMATIGRMRAIANIKWPFRAHASGTLAWLSWLLIHIFFLNGLRSRFLVFWEWAWTLFSTQRGAQIITDMKIIEASQPVTITAPHIKDAVELKNE